MNSLKKTKKLNSSQDTLVNRTLNSSQETLVNGKTPRLVNDKLSKNSSRDTLYEMDIEEYIDYYTDDKPNDFIKKEKYKLQQEIESKIENIKDIYEDNLEEITQMDYIIETIKESQKILNEDIKDLKTHLDDINKFSYKTELKRSNTVSKNNSDSFFNKMSGLARKLSTKKNAYNKPIKTTRILSDENNDEYKNIESLKTKIINTIYDKKLEITALKEMFDEIKFKQNKLLMINDQNEQELEFLHKTSKRIQEDIDNLNITSTEEFVFEIVIHKNLKGVLRPQTLMSISQLPGKHFNSMNHGNKLVLVNNNKEMVHLDFGKRHGIQNGSQVFVKEVRIIQGKQFAVVVVDRKYIS